MNIVTVNIFLSGEAKIIRECENELMKSAYHRLRMPVLRRHGYCEPSRKNDFWNPTETTDSNIQYCFCNDWNGCNSAPKLFSRTLPILSLCMLLVYIVKKIVVWEFFHCTCLTLPMFHEVAIKEWKKIED